MKFYVHFELAFSRAAAFEWFVVIVVGLMVRSDHLGVTSIVRDLALHPRHYESMIHFFRSSAWSPGSLRLAWQKVVHRFAPLLYVRGRVVLVGDGMKQAKEGRHMPGVKKLHQESENVSKGEYIFGHLFGAIGILAGAPQKWFCLPLFMNLQDGVKAIFGWADGSEERQTSHVVQMVEQAFVAARTFGGALLLLDRYFLSIPALQRLTEGNRAGDAHGDRLSILVSTDLALEATEIITLYGYRFKIECTFREMKQVIGAFGYRFWSASMPKLNRYRRKAETDPLEQVTNESARKRIRLTLRAIEGFVMCSVIATGIVQLLALRFSGRTPALFFRYLRTPSKSIVSEATVVAYLRQSLFRLFAQNPHLALTQIIRSKQQSAHPDADSLASCM